MDVHGDLACFSRPELSVERFSYPCPTPSAVRGIFDAIYCKPRKFRWQAERVEILNPVRVIPLRRNEVKETVNDAAVSKWLRGTAPLAPILADADKTQTGSDEKGRTQRQTMALADVRYRLTAHLKPWPGQERERTAFEQQFRRRAGHGKCFQQPYFGCREFVAYYRLLGEQPDADRQPRPVPHEEDVGWMVYDVFDLSRPGTSTDRPAVSLFRARIEGGVLTIPAYDDRQVRKPNGSDNGGTA